MTIKGGMIVKCLFRYNQVFDNDDNSIVSSNIPHRNVYEKKFLNHSLWWILPDDIINYIVWKKNEFC